MLGRLVSSAVALNRVRKLDTTQMASTTRFMQLPSAAHMHILMSFRYQNTCCITCRAGQLVSMYDANMTCMTAGCRQ